MWPAQGCPTALSRGARCCPLAGRQEPGGGLQLTPCQGRRKGSGAHTGGSAPAAPRDGGWGAVHSLSRGLQNPGGMQGVGGQDQHCGPCHHPTAGHGCGLGGCCWAVGARHGPTGDKGSRTLYRKEGHCWPRGCLAKGVPAAGAGAAASPGGAASPATLVRPPLPTTPCWRPAGLVAQGHPTPRFKSHPGVQQHLSHYHQ